MKMGLLKNVDIAMKITVGIPTKNRYDSLNQTLLSIALQTLKPYEVIIVDDSDNPVNLTTLPHYRYIFQLLDSYEVIWRVQFGIKRGQHYSHQYIQDTAKGDFIFRIDDDEIAEPNCLAHLCSLFDAEVGAIGPLVLMPNAIPLPGGITNNINELNKPNVQWFKSNDTHSVDHLYSCFMYRKGVETYNLELSTVAHREETLFTYGIKLKGYKLVVTGGAKVWHFRSDSGGIRSFQDERLWEHDEKIFQNIMKSHSVKFADDEVMVVLKNGLGDHWAFKNLLPELRRRKKKITIAASFADVFWGESDIKVISIPEAELLLGDTRKYDIYCRMADWNWKGTLVEAFEKLYL